MATVNFKPLADVAGLNIKQAAEVRHNEMLDVLSVMNLLEATLADVASFQKRVSPVLDLVGDSQVAHVQRMAVIAKAGESGQISSQKATQDAQAVITWMGYDVIELREALKRAAELDGK